MIQPKRGYLNNVCDGLLVAGFFACLISATSTQAGTGSAISAAASIDTRSPQVVVIDPPENYFILAGEMFVMQWSATDDNPSAALGYNVAEVWIGGQLQASYPFDSATSSHQWTWTAPDTTSALAHLVVNSRDTFGNNSIVAGEYFTILSSVTHVPEASQAAIFALPAPNPFNPMTELSFNLPQSGPATVTVHDARGYRVNTLLSGNQSAGPLTLRWDGRDKAGRRQAGGTYFFRLQFSLDGRNEHLVRKAVLLP